MTQRTNVQSASTSQTPDPHVPTAVVNGTLGGLVAIVASFLPFSTLLGGAVAGYRQGDSGAAVGALAGVVALIPALVGGVAVLVLSVPVPGPRLAPELVAALAAAYTLFYVVGPSVVGGVVGSIARRRGWLE